MSSQDELTTAVDAFVADVQGLHNGMGTIAAFSQSLSTLIAVVIGKSAAMAAGAVTSLAKPFLQRMDQSELRMGRIETQLKVNSRFLHEVHTRLDKYAELHTLIDECMSRIDEIEKERGADGDGS